MTDNVFRREYHLARVKGFGVEPKLTCTRIANLLMLYPNHVQSLTGPKLSNFDTVERLISNPDRVTSPTIDVLSAKSSEHRQALLTYKEKVSAEEAGTLASLPNWMATVPIIRELVEDRRSFNQRLLLLQQMTPFMDDGERRSTSGKAFKGAADQLLDFMIIREARECRISRKPFHSRDERVKLLVTYGEQSDHGRRQGNCIGSHTTGKRILKQVTLGEKVLVEARLGNRVYSAEILLGPDPTVGLIQLGEKEVSVSTARLVAALIRKAFGLK